MKTVKDLPKVIQTAVEEVRSSLVTNNVDNWGLSIDQIAIDLWEKHNNTDTVEDFLHQIAAQVEMGSDLQSACEEVLTDESVFREALTSQRLSLPGGE